MLFFFYTNKSCNPLSLKLSLLLALLSARPLAWISAVNFDEWACWVGISLLWDRGWCLVHTYLNNDGDAFCLFSPSLQLTTSWCSLAEWLRMCSPWTTTTQCVHYKPFPLPFPVLTASWLVSKGAWVSILSKEAVCHMIPNSCWCRLWSILKRSGKNAVVEDHSVAEEKVKGIF